MRRGRPVQGGLAYGMWLVVLGLWQFTPCGWDVLWGGRPLLFVPFIVSTAMFTGPLIGGWLGCAAGFFWGVYAAAPFGVHALLLLIIGCATGLLERFLLRNNAVAALLLCAVATAVTVGADCLWGVAVWQRVVVNAVYTLLWSIPVYAMMRATYARLTKRR